MLSQVQGRSYANIFGLAERFIGAKMLEMSREHALGDQVALEALVRFTDEELKHQALFRRIEEMLGAGMPAGYVCAAEPNAVAHAVSGFGATAVFEPAYTRGWYTETAEHVAAERASVQTRYAAPGPEARSV